MPSETLKRNYPLLKYIASRKSKVRRHNLLKELAAHPEIYDSLCEICLNTVKRNIKLTKQQRSKLRKHTNCIFLLATRKGSKKIKSELTVQGGGAILPILIPALTSVISALLSRAEKDGKS